ncbi:MAG: hypothetical protein ACT4OJ_00535 [Bacteroidota bacterium]
MATTSASRSTWFNTLSILLLFPATYVIVISVLKYGWGIDGPFDASAPLLESMGIKEPPGWNINLLILFGPLLAMIFSALQVLHIDWHFNREQADFRITIRKKWWPLSIALFGGLVLLTLAIYLFGENFQLVS